MCDGGTSMIDGVERDLKMLNVCWFYSQNCALYIMMKDQFANYVVQRMIDVADPVQRKQLVVSSVHTSLSCASTLTANTFLRSSKNSTWRTALIRSGSPATALSKATIAEETTNRLTSIDKSPHRNQLFERRDVLHRLFDPFVHCKFKPHSLLLSS